MSPEREQQLEAEIARSREAQSIVTSPIFVESIAKMKQGIIDKWAACPARDTEGREWLWQHYQVALKFEEAFTEALNTGKLALKEREQSMFQKIQGLVRR
jgi:phosphopantothenoylcysteine synthetase/decarboxylase